MTSYKKSIAEILAPLIDDFSAADRRPYSRRNRADDRNSCR